MLNPSPGQVRAAFLHLGEPANIPAEKYVETFPGFDPLDCFDDEDRPPRLVVFRSGMWICDYGDTRPQRYALELCRSQWESNDLHPLVCYVAAWEQAEFDELDPLLAEFDREIW